MAKTDLLMRREFRQLEIELAPRAVDPTLGFLYRFGISSTEVLRRRAGTLLRAEVPKGFPFADFSRQLRDWERQAFARKVFKKLRLREVRDLSWIAKYKKFLAPFPLLEAPAAEAKRLWVDPRGKLPAKPRPDTLYIEAGLAFGTGTHTTTQLAAELLAAALQGKKRSAVLDLGCGTGILAMAAKRLGAGKTVAVDIDPEALAVARENFRRNRQGSITLRKDLAGLRGRFPIIVSNIGLQVLLDLRPQLLRRLAPGGTLILTGLLYRDCDELLRAYRSLRLRRRINRKGWTAVALGA
ncbi:MAG: 50S ribosomal protein L11 methyltransferase [bacterium]